MGSNDGFFTKNQSCASRVIDDQAVIVKVTPLEGNKVFSLNRTGTLIWELTDGKTSISNIVNRLRTEFEVRDDVDLEDDVYKYLEEMRQRELISIHD